MPVSFAVCCHQVRAQVLEIIASDPGLQQTELVFLGLFGRWGSVVLHQAVGLYCRVQALVT
jgi:hypothetical protein